MNMTKNHKTTIITATRMMKFCTVLLIALVALTMTSVHGFTMPSARDVVKSHRYGRRTSSSPSATATSLNMMVVDPQVVVDTVSTFSTTSTSTMMIAETEAWVQPTALFLGPFLNFMSFAMLCRVVASWYPETNLNEFPWAIVAWPSEPLLRLVKGSIPPAFGVDITPVFWLAIFTFFNEILLGQQGLLVMKMKYGI
mmetsp:Transcript_51522/g.124403  ORF Transcript_51522/g.124403 Transcript_51522/m.124403 type:complete len:197 (-) Transcript_51522:214-804(-)